MTLAFCLINNNNICVTELKFCVRFDFEGKVGRNQAVSMYLHLIDNYTFIVYDNEHKEVTKLTNVNNSFLVLNNSQGFITFIPSNSSKQTEKSITFK